MEVRIGIYNLIAEITVIYGDKMKEQELNTLMSVITDPICNVYKFNSRKDVEEIQRMTRIFSISENQHNKHRMLSIKSLATMKLILSNN